jgi:hypothetical protein
MKGAAIRFTLGDLQHFPKTAGATVVDGDLVFPRADPAHGRLLSHLMVELVSHLGPVGRKRVVPGPLDVRAGGKVAVRPDLVVLPKGAELRSRPWFIPTPVWAAFFQSGDVSAAHVAAVLDRCEHAAIEEVWLVDPKTETIVVSNVPKHRWRTYASGRRASSRALRRFRVDVAELFAA